MIARQTTEQSSSIPSGMQWNRSTGTVIRKVTTFLLLGVLISCFAGVTYAVEPSSIFDPVMVSRSLWLLESDDDLADDLAVARSDDDELDVDGDADDLDDEENLDDEPNADLNRSIYGNAEDRQPSFDGGRFVLPSLMAPTTDITEIGNGRQAEDFRGDESTPLIGLPENLFDRGLPGGYTIRQWAAPNTFSHPRYFEDRMLERHGHERFACVQPFASGFRFFATVPMLPYLAMVREPCDCEYTLGYYRSGSCAPLMLQRPPYERRAVIAEALTIAGATAALP